MSTRDSSPLWSVPVAVAEIPESGRHLDLVADEGVRTAIAKLAGVPGLPRLEAEFHLTRHGRGGVRVVGTVSATVKQNCVVSLEPMENLVEEKVDLVFLPASTTTSKAGAEEDVSLIDDPPEVLRDGTVDLGAAAIEFLLLGIDPYPRKPGTVLEVQKTEEHTASRPFAALAALRKSDPGPDRS